MFFKCYKYRLKSFIKNRNLYFWSLIFPFILGTLFYFAFGNYMEGTGELLETIPVAVVKGEVSQEKENFVDVLEQLSSPKDGENAMLEVQEVSKDKAEELLNEKSVDGIIYINSALSMTVAESGINQTILKNILDQYLRKEAAIVDIMKTHPEKLQDMMQVVEQDRNYLHTISLNESTSNPMNQYFYALIAMACLYCCFYGISISSDLQGNLSTLAARRIIAPSNKLSMIMCDYLAAFTLAAIGILVLFLYFICILKIDFGDKLIFTIFTALVGCMFAIAFGAFLGSSPHQKRGTKISMGAGIMLFLSFLAGLMAMQMPYYIERNLPIINRINPAMLLADSFYCLTFYQNDRTYWSNMAILIVYTVIFIGWSAFKLRREKYASI